MKLAPIKNYVFNASTKSIVFLDFKVLRLECILLITNVISNVIIYNFADPLKGGNIIGGNILILDYNTSAMSNNDSLQIYYDDSDTNAATDESILLLRRIVHMLEASATVDRNMRQRVTLDAIQLSGAGITTELAGNLPVSMIGVVNASVSGNIGVSGITQTLGQGTTFGPPYSVTNTTYQAIWEGPVDQRFRVAEESHTAYQLRVRNALTFA